MSKPYVVVDYDGSAKAYCAASRAVMHYGRQAVILVCSRRSVNRYHDNKDDDTWFTLVEQAKTLDVTLARTTSKMWYETWIEANYPRDAAEDEYGYDDVIRVYDFTLAELKAVNSLRSKYGEWNVEVPLCWEEPLDDATCEKMAAHYGVEVLPPR